jgi:hypothetical protein
VTCGREGLFLSLVWCLDSLDDQLAAGWVSFTVLLDHFIINNNLSLILKKLSGLTDRASPPLVGSQLFARDKMSSMSL